MTSKKWLLIAAGLGLLSACGDDNPRQGDAPQDNADAGSMPGPQKPSTNAPLDYVMQAVTLTEDLVVPPGKLVRVGPGVTFTGTAGVKIEVQGTLLVEGTADAPSAFVGNGAPESWHGIVVASGGQLFLEHAQVSGAEYGVHALPGSSYAIDRSVFESSFKGAVLEADGSLTNSIFKAVALFPAVTEAVSIDDPNGYLTIINASPTVTNCRFDGSGGLNDMVRIGGEASPVFDRCHVNNSHCGFHTSGGTNTSARITNTVFEKLSYGIMAYATQPIIENSVFTGNSNDVGFCFHATTDNTPLLKGNFFADGPIRLDASCDMIGTQDPSPAATRLPNVGPSGL